MLGSAKRQNKPPVSNSGFSLIATLSVATLLIIVSLAILSLSTIESRSNPQIDHQQLARDHARLALMIALGEMQRLLGPDQRVTAKASILEDTPHPLPHRNWLGVWKTTYKAYDREWPLIGKAPKTGPSPYPYSGIYTDLRETLPHLQNDQWKNKLCLGWLVSGHQQQPNKKEDEMTTVEILGRGTLGDELPEDDYNKLRVIVSKINIRTHKTEGAYAWYVSDNSQKACISLTPDIEGESPISFYATQSDNPTSLRSSNGQLPYADFKHEAQGEYDKLITSRNAALVGNSEASRKILSRSLGENFHDLTTRADGLFVDVTLGALKKDLTPLLFGAPDQNIINFPSPSTSVSTSDFSSDSPIIPDPRHAVLGPSFGALRYWGLIKYLDGLENGIIDAQVSHPDSSSVRTNPTDDWPDGISDGLTFDASQWGSRAPKIHPIMTDARWHYYFSHTEGTSNSIRSHIIPRVCLWNPYNVSIQTRDLIVLMANPFRTKNNFHFIFNEEEARRLKAKYTDPRYYIDIWGRIDSENKHVGPFKIQPTGETKGGKKSGLFPDSRYLGFLLEASRFAPGECLVFSPQLTHPDHTRQGIGIQRYNEDDISANRLSAKKLQGEDHFFHDYQGDFKLQVERLQPITDDNGDPDTKITQGWRTISDEVFLDMFLGAIDYYEPWPILYDNFPFVLKTGYSETLNTSETPVSIDQLVASTSHFHTLQLINNGHGGVATSKYWMSPHLWESSGTPFGALETFQQSPGKSPPPLHQFGSKLMWLNESTTEASDHPFRYGFWDPDHVAYNPASVAQWNVRPALVTRSPASPCANSWRTNSSGAWIQQFSPLPPADFNDMPKINDRGYFTKSPLGQAAEFSSCSSAVLFDLPSPELGTLSIGSLRHASLSPYSWHPSYIVSHSLADIHAPFDASAKPSLANAYSGLEHSSWDEAIGGSHPYPLLHGPRTRKLNSSGLLQIGNHEQTRKINNQPVSSRDEILAYDIAFEVNLNLWDQYFVSGLPMNDTGSAFAKNLNQPGKSPNRRYQFNYSSPGNIDRSFKKLESSDGLAFGFWHNALLLKNRGAFNVNSTSEKAWFTFLSGLQGLPRATESGQKSGDAASAFSRVQIPSGVAKTEELDVTKNSAWAGGRLLSQNEIAVLAREIVKEVKRRGPFVSMSDFVNRRLAPKPKHITRDSPMMCGTLEAAISRSGLNRAFEKHPFLTTTNTAYDNNRDDAMERWKIDIDKQPRSKAWGIPGYLTQGDILEPMAPAMTVRGDSFTVRCYGESKDERGVIQARAWLQAEVTRTPEYVLAAGLESPDSEQVNKATEAAWNIERPSGELMRGSLSETNRKFGRKIRIQSMRWLTDSEI